MDFDTIPNNFRTMDDTELRRTLNRLCELVDKANVEMVNRRGGMCPTSVIFGDMTPAQECQTLAEVVGDEVSRLEKILHGSSIAESANLMALNHYSNGLQATLRRMAGQRAAA